MARNRKIIESPGKIGIGTWDFDAKGTAIEHVDDMGFGWYYNWQPGGLWDADASTRPDASFIPMIWDEAGANGSDLGSVTSLGGKFLLGFNEPDNSTQAGMSVAEAINLWPQLMATGKLLGSPAVTTGQTLGNNTWLDRFMEAADAEGLRVDFMAVHYYAETPDIGAFRKWLVAVHEKYDRPIWVTEWALIDWNNTDRYSKAEIADFARKATLMMDDLNFVKRHAWFSSYDYDYGGGLDTELFDRNGNLTRVGDVFANLLGNTVAKTRSFAGTDEDDAVTGTRLSDRLSGGSGSDRLKGYADDDSLRGGFGNDLLRGGDGRDVLKGGGDDDQLFGAWGRDILDGGVGNDSLRGGTGRDLLAGGLGADLFVFTSLADSGTNFATRDRIADFADGDRIDLSWIDAIAGGSNDSFVLDADGSFSAGEIRQQVVDGNLLVEVNVDDDAAAEFSLMLNGRTTPLTETDFVL